MNKQGKNGIGWTDYTWNPLTGCNNNCFYCYAKQIGMRFYGNFIPAFHENRLEQPYKKKKPSKIFVCSMSDLFGEWIPAEWIDKIIEVAKDNPQHTFQFLTKNPTRYFAFTFPDNCRLGATTVNANTAGTFADNLRLLDNKTFISAEPLLEDIADYIDYDAVDWIIIGEMTGKFAKKYCPKRKWIENVVNKAKEYNIPVFLKNNLKDIWKGELIQEFPEEKK